jgi:two-component system, NtrC family, response regulator PilR
MQKRILVVSHDSMLRETRAALLLRAGYSVSTSEGGDSAMGLLEGNVFDLILVGRKSLAPGKGIAQRIRERYPDVLILKIAELIEEDSPYPSKTTNSLPVNVLAALDVMLSDAPEKIKPN